MAIRPRRNHSPASKAKVAVAAIKGEKTLTELAQQLDVYPNQITQWPGQLLEGASGVFGDAVKAKAAPAVDVKALHAKIGELTLENAFFVRRARQGRSVPGRKAMIDRDQGLGLCRQAGASVAELCRKHGMSSATFYAWKVSSAG